MLITFTTPAPLGVEYVRRNHPLVGGLACHILEDALSNTQDPIAAKCGLTITDAVTKRTILLLLRLRHLLSSVRRNADNPPSLLAEECAVVGFTGPPTNPTWLAPEVGRTLLEQANPVGDAPPGLKKQEVEELLGRIEEFAQERSHVLSQSHRRVRALTREGVVQVTPQLPMDLLGVYILQLGRRK